MLIDVEGRLLTHSPDTYKIPALGDTPEDFRVALLERAPQDNTIAGPERIGAPRIPVLRCHLMPINTSSVVSRSTFMIETPGQQPGTGWELPASLRLRMECFFGGVDLSAVRIHVGSRAPALGALAFAQGDEVHFAPGLYDSENPRCQRLLVHELAHVLQQRAGRVPFPGPHLPVVDAPQLEAEAEALADGFARGWRQAPPVFLGALHAHALGALPAAVPGGAAACHPIQRVVYLERLHPKVGYASLFWCKRVQELLKDEDKVLSLLTELEKEIEQAMSGKGGKTTLTSKLSQVLVNTEAHWMNKGVIKLLPDQGIVEVYDFLEQHMKQRKALKDVAAGPQHGEYTHRIQWYMIYHFMKKIVGLRARDLAQPLYDEMVNPRHVSKNIIGQRVSLWDSVLDVRLSWTKGQKSLADKEVNAELRKVYEDVLYASAPILNDALTKTNQKFIQKCPNLHQALVARREKRIEQKKRTLEEQKKISEIQTQVASLSSQGRGEDIDSLIAHQASTFGPSNLDSGSGSSLSQI